MEVTNIESLTLLPNLAVFYDDEVGTIEPHMQKARSLGVFPVVAKTVPELLSLMIHFRERAIFFLDMHVPGINDLGMIQCADLETNDGSSFGTAMYSAFSKLNGRRPIKYANILSGRPIEESAYQVLSELEDHDFIIDDIEKSDQSKFDSTLKDYLRGSATEAAQLDMAVETKNQDEVRQIDLVVDILADFGVDDPQHAASLAMGYHEREANNFVYIKGLAAENLARGQGDIRMRVDFVVFIKSGISSLLGVDNVPAQQIWMNSKNEALGERTPLEMICSSDINDIALVAALINRVLS